MDDNEFLDNLISNDTVDYAEGSESLVDPHYVEPYLRSDGTPVSGYWRDGDGNTNVDLTLKDGGGYIRRS